MQKIILTFLLLTALGSPTAAFASLDYRYPAYRSLIGRNSSADGRAAVKQPLAGITSHHLPTASPLIDNFYSQLKRSRPDIETFVVIGPDHFERCRQKFVVATEDVQTSFGRLEIDQDLVRGLVKTGVRMENRCFKGEHSIGVQANYIGKFYPQAKIVPILLSYSAKSRDFGRVIELLEQRRSRLFIVQSTDFSHYQSWRQADAIDEITRHQILRMDGQPFSLKQVDSPATIKLVLGLAKSLKLKPVVTEHKNSAVYSGQLTNTTSYFNIFF